jgi:NADH-quinone oxidoreductase subunit M
MLQRIIYNPLDKAENASLADLSARELAVLLPLVAGIVWLGLFPGPVLQRIEPAARHYIETVRGPIAALDLSQRIPGARP